MSGATPDVLVVGAGMAGISCALHVLEAGKTVRLLEASDAPGGRVRTDRCEGFLLDRGFQVLLTAYPEAKRLLDYETLQLKCFTPGALVYFDDRFHRVQDPWRKPAAALSLLFGPIGTLREKLRLARLRRRLLSPATGSTSLGPAPTTAEFLRDVGLGGPILERFFRPFLGGIFLESDLVTTSRMFQFVFRMFGIGEAALPALGMGALAEQLVSRLPPGTLRTGMRVASVDDGAATLDSGERQHAQAIVVATDGREALRLVGAPEKANGRAVTCLYFATERPPVHEPILLLDGTGTGPVNNLCVPSVVSPDYAPAGQSLVSASVLGDPAWDDAELEDAVRRQLRGWFGADVDAWRHLRTYRIRDALPDQRPGEVDGALRPVQPRPRLFLCGDHCESGSLQGALSSGRRAAEAVVASLRA